MEGKYRKGNRDTTLSRAQISAPIHLSRPSPIGTKIIMTASLSLGLESNGQFDGKVKVKVAISDWLFFYH